MKKIIFTKVVFLTGPMAFASSEIKKISNYQIFCESEAEPCSVTVTKFCAATGTMVNSTRTSSSGDCTAAFTVAKQGWSSECRLAGSRKVITEMMETETGSISTDYL